MGREGFYRVVSHHARCFAMEFCCLDRQRPYDFSRRKNGYRNGSTMFFRFRCNDPKCPAILLVRWDVLGAFLNQGPNGLVHDA